MPICELLTLQPAAQNSQVVRWDQMDSGLSASSIPVSGSPVIYQNTSGGPGCVLVSGGTVTTINWSRDNSTYYLVGLLAGMFHVSAGDYIKVNYVIGPTMTFVPF